MSDRLSSSVSRPRLILGKDASRIIFENAVRQAGWEFKQNLIWAKDTMVVGRNDYHWRHEPILYGYTSGSTGRRRRFPTRQPVVRLGQRHPDPGVPQARKEHPTMKPVDQIAH